jgi:hypothetical protein
MYSKPGKKETCYYHFPSGMPVSKIPKRFSALIARKPEWMSARGSPHLHPVPETSNHMVVHHAGRLHEGVADRGVHKFESSLLQIFAHCIGF